MKENELLLIDKPSGWTSFDVVAKVRSKIRAGYSQVGVKPAKRQLKVGHTGTLDPFATGLMIILLGDACSQSDRFLKLDKVYEATLCLGKTSTTGDTEGDISDVSSIEPGIEEINSTLRQFEGKITQVPPIFSAIKINGQRAYNLAREGKVFEMPPRQVEIYKLDLLGYHYPEVQIRAHVSSGTYIRTLGEDIGKSLGTGAYCTSLRRTRIGDYTIENSIFVSEVDIDKILQT